MGACLAAAIGRFLQFYPEPGQVEHDAGILFQSAIDAGRDALRAAAVNVDAIGITNQRETLVLWDRATLAPIGRAIVWQDRRTAATRCAGAKLRAAGRARKQFGCGEKTGLLIDPYFSATKLEWLLALPDVQEVLARGALRAGTVESWIATRLTNGAVHVSDVTNSCRTLLADLMTGDWDDELLKLFGIPRAILPTSRAECGSGRTRPEREWFGAPFRSPALAGDQQAALFGTWLRSTPGMAKVTYGTGAFLLRFTGDESPPQPRPGILATIAAGARGQRAWALEGSVFIAGAAVQWLRDGLGLIEHAAETAALAASVADSGGVVIVPAFTGLGAPYWNAEARGTITGITRGTTRAHLVRAILESIAHQVAATWSTRWVASPRCGSMAERRRTTG